MDYESLVEKNVNHMMEKMFGEKDPALKTITKMNILYDGTDDTKTDIECVLRKMKKMNAFEAQCIGDELELTYDKDGNVVSINSIKDETENIFWEESKSEQDTDFNPSNR
jgi:uncharacterized protein YuzE